MKLTHFLWQQLRPVRPYLILGVTCTFVTALFHTSLSFLIGHLVDAVTGNNESLTFWVVAFNGAWFLDLAITWRILDWSKLKWVPILRHTVQNSIFDRLCLQPHQFFQDNFAGALAGKLKDLEESTLHIVWYCAYTYLHAAIVLLTSLIVAVTVHPFFGLVLICWAGFFIVLTAVRLERFNALTKECARVATQVIGTIADVISNMLGVKLFASAAREQRLIQQATTGYETVSMARRWFLLKLFTVLAFSFWFYQATALVGLCYLRLHGYITPGDFALILSMNIGLIDILWRLGESMRDFSEYVGNAQAALETFYAPLSVQDAPYAPPLYVSKGGITFDQVLFSYNAHAEALHIPHLVIPGGQKVGLVGYSGSGKTTFVHLLLRLYDLSKGTIAIDGQNIAHITQCSLHEAITFVPQEAALFHRTLKQNITYGRPYASLNDVERAAHKAAIHDWVTTLPNKYETVVGERGTKLSGGQRQRIALARAFLKQSPILILDEATAALDTVTEQRIALPKNGQTVIVVAHRLNTVATCDRILVFENGSIVQDGTPHELEKQEGLYKKLWELQQSSDKN